MEDFFGPEGILKSRLPHFEYRRQQQELAEKIDSFLDSPDRLLAAEAPTGVGKTYAMLIPAIDWALKNNETVLILTSGITLQEQLIDKDIPALLKVLGVDLPYGLMKGRGNYVCMRKAREISQEGFLDFGGDKGSASRDIGEWLFSTETGDLSELSLSDDHPARERIASSYLTCMGGLCPHREHCFYAKMMRSAVRWRIVVANYHVYFSYLLGQRAPFPVPHGLVFCDEAHKIAEAARSVTSVTADRREWKRMMRRAPKLDRVDPALMRIVGCSAADFADGVSSLSHASEVLFDTMELKLENGKSFSEYPPALQTATTDLLAKCDSILGQLKSLQAEAGDDGMQELNALGDDGKIAMWRDELQAYRDSLRWCSDTAGYPHWAYWYDKGSLKSSCVEGRDLVPEAFADSGKIVALSATLTVDGSFEYWAEETGLTPDETILLDSPFPLEKLMQIHIVMTGLKSIDSDYPEVVSKVCRVFARQNGGATLILLSSKRLLSAVSSYLKEHAGKDDLNILVQGDLPRGELLEHFKKEPRSVLIGMASFREGIDIPGNALTQVIIDRIPFPHPDDPVGKARRELAGPADFVKNVLPAAKMQLRQAIGRLIRTGSDRGKVVILDERIARNRKWGMENSLPKVPVFTRPLKR